MSKGSTPRPVDRKKFEEGWSRTFGDGSQDRPLTRGEREALERLLRRLDLKLPEAVADNDYIFKANPVEC